MGRKKVFEMDVLSGNEQSGITVANARIIGTAPKNIPYLNIDLPETGTCACIKDKDLERFAISILESLGYEILPLSAGIDSLGRKGYKIQKDS